MPAKSQQQQKFMGMVHALNKGDIKPSDVSKSVRDVAKNIKKSDAEDFASTKHSGLPKRVKQEILKALKEYANKMSGNKHGGSGSYGYAPQKGLRDDDGYTNESKLKGQLAGDSVQDIIKSIGSRFVSGEIKNTKRDGKTYIKLKDEKFGSGVVKILKSRFGIDAKIDYYGGKGKVASTPSVSFFSDTIIDESKGVPQNYMQGRTSDYHTALRGKNRDYSGGTNFKKTNHGQPDIENDDEDQETNQLSVQQTKLKEEMSNLTSAERIELYKLYSKAMKAMPGSPNQKKIKILINKLRKKADLKPLPVSEYGQRLDLSYLEDEEARLKGTPKPKDAIDRDIDEYSGGSYEYTKGDQYGQNSVDEGTMIRLAGQIAQELLPKDTWSRFSNDGRKNKEFVKNIVKDLAQTLNRFYKSHNISVKIKENKIELNEIGVFDIKSYVKGIIPSSFFNTTTREKKEKLQSTLRDLKSTLNRFWKQHKIPYRIK